MKTVILGAGSLGCVFGGFIAAAGGDVVLIARRRSHVEAINRNGLAIDGVKGKRVVRVTATDEPGEVQEADLLVLLVKTVDTAKALDGVSHLQDKVKLAVSLQNGLSKDQHLKERFGAERVIGGATMTGGLLLGDGEVEFTADGPTYFGELGGGRSERVESVVRMFRSAGLKSEAVDDIHSVEWAKLMMAAPGLAASALTRLELHKVHKSKPLAEFFVRLVKETAAVAARDGAELASFPGLALIKNVVDSDFDLAVQLVNENGLALERAGQTNITPSMLQSIMKGKKTEVHDTIGYIANKAKEYGMRVPALELCYQIIGGLDDYLSDE